MKTFKSSKMLLASSVILALSGCGSEDYTPAAKANNTAPTHGGDISIALHEKDALMFVNLLGTPLGASSGEGVATDADGNYLSVTDVSIQTSGSRVDDIAELGAELNGNQIAIRPSAIEPLLDTDETHTIVVNYNIFDGKNKTPRTATFTFTGEDFAPEAVGDLVGNFTKDAGTGVLNLLTNVTDADEELLMVEQSSVIADAANLFAIPFTVVDNMLNLDVASVEDQIPDGSKVTFNYTYKIKDHNHEVERNMIINILGVKDVEGAPLIGSYFLTDEVDETASMQNYDLLDDVVEREGDAMSVKNLKLNGSDLPYGVMLDGSMLKFSPNAFMTEIDSGANSSFEFTFQIEDEHGNTSDGERSLAITVNGVESNIVAAQGASHTFEGDALGGGASDWYNFGWQGAGGATVSTDSAHFGNNGVELLPGGGMAVDWSAQADRIYYYAGWSKTVGANGNANFPVHFNAYGKNDAGRAWWAGGARQWVADTTVWAETAITFNTFSWGWPIYPDASFQVFNGPADSHSTVTAYVDDIRIVDITDIDGYANNMLAAGSESFEDGEVPANNGVGSVSVTDTATDVTLGTNALVVDTTGNATASEVLLPVQAGAIKTGGRYMLSLDIHATNAQADTATGFEVKLETASGQVHNFYPSTWSNTANAGVRVMLNTDSATGTPDWENEDVSLRLSLKVADIVYHIDNVALYAIP